MQPCREARALVEVIDRPKGRQVTLLHGIAGLLFVAQKPARHGQEAPAVLAHEALEGFLVSAFQPRDKIALRGRLVAPSRAYPRFQHASALPPASREDGPDELFGEFVRGGRIPVPARRLAQRDRFLVSLD